MLRVDPQGYAQKRADARVKAKQVRSEAIERELANATFKPEIFTKRRGSFDKPPSQSSLEDQVKSQLQTADIFEAPLPATLKRLNMEKSSIMPGGKNEGYGYDGVIKGGGNGEHIPQGDEENVENRNVYKPRDSYESFDLRGNGQNRGPSQADADAAFQLSLRTEEAGYNIDAVVPMGTKAATTASNRAKGVKIPISSRRASADSVTIASSSPASNEGFKSPQKNSKQITVACVSPKTPPPLGESGRSNAHSNFDSYLSPNQAAPAAEAAATTTSSKKSTGTGGKSRPSSAGTPRSAKKVSPLKFTSQPNRVGSSEKRQARSRLSLLKSKMPPRKSESARPSRRIVAAGAVLSPAAGAKERRRASLSAAVQKFDSQTFSGALDAEAEAAEETLNMSVSASESQLQHLGSAVDSSETPERVVYQQQQGSGRRGSKAAPIVHKAAKLDRLTLRARRSADMEGFNPVTGEPLSPTPVDVQQGKKGVKQSSGSPDRGGKEPSGHPRATTSTVQQSIEIHHKIDAEKKVPQIFLDLPEDAFDSVESTVGELLACPHCDRKFGEKALARHVKVCKTVFLEKPKVFNSSRMRISGVAKLNKADNTEMMILEGAVSAAGGMQSTSINSPTAARMARKKKEREEKERLKRESKQTGAGGTKKVGSGVGDAKWKSQSAALRQAMMEARGKGPKGGDVQVIESVSLIPCPHCNRKFNQTAAERHIPQCQSIKAKPKMLKKNTGMSAVAKALGSSKSTKSTMAMSRIL